jgi:hypothetical protein
MYNIRARCTRTWWCAGEFEESTRQHTEWDRGTIDERHCDTSKRYLCTAEETAHASQVKKEERRSEKIEITRERGDKLELAVTLPLLVRVHSIVYIYEF